MLNRLLSRLRRSSEWSPGSALYFALLQQARHAVFFRDWGVPDTVDGRFDMIVLHAALVFRRLRAFGPAAQDLTDETFAAMTGDLDRSVRELGGGDLGVGKRMKAIGQAFYGRVHAYDAAFAGTEPLDEVLRRNVYRNGPVQDAQVRSLTAYVQAAAGRLEACSLADLAAAKPDFPAPA